MVYRVPSHQQELPESGQRAGGTPRSMYRPDGIQRRRYDSARESLQIKFLLNLLTYETPDTLGSFVRLPYQPSCIGPRAGSDE